MQKTKRLKNMKLELKYYLKIILFTVILKNKLSLDKVSKSILLLNCFYKKMCLINL